MNKSVDGKVFAIKDLGDVAGATKTVVVKSAKDAVKKMDDKLAIISTDGKVGDLLKKIKPGNSKDAIDSQLNVGAIAVLVLKDQIKLYKVVDTRPQPPADQTPAQPAPPPVNNPTPPADQQPTPPATPAEDVVLLSDSGEASATAPQDILTFNYLSRLKAQSKMADIKAQPDMQAELDAAKLQRPSDVGENYGFTEITSLCVEKVGILDNERTDYGEKKSTLNVVEGPFEMATHVVVGDEPTADKPCGAPSKKADSSEE
jgi:hypothetical protein